jgi:fatty acid desaturase
MSTGLWILLIIAGVILLEGILWLVGVGGVLLWIGTALYHAFKLDPIPGENDDNWSQEQGREIK